MNLVVGSGDTRLLLSGTHTKGFASLLQKFVSDIPPNYNSFASPIDALRTGAILEGRYLETLDDSYFIQYKVTHEKYDCATSSIDFAKLDGGKVVDFDELKTIYFTDYIEIIVPLTEMEEAEQLEFIKKRFKANYNQIQFQLLCSGLESANLVFLSVESYEDDVNYSRMVKTNDFHKFRIHRDNDVIEKIMERLAFFQRIKNYTKK